ncbi:MAG: helix-turn-helix transcriptional regulator [Alcanivoracaceae bacterium]
MQGRLFLWADGWMLLAGPIHNRRHRHVAASLLFGLDQPLAVEAGGKLFSGRAVLVAPDVVQSLDSGGNTLVVHLDPDSALWLTLSDAVETGRLLPWAEEEAECLATLMDCDDASAARTLLASMPGFANPLAITAAGAWGGGASGQECSPPTRLDQRAVGLARRLREDLPERLDLTGLADQAGLSAARLSRLFRDTFGVTPKRFLLHLKMQRALHHWQPGMTAAELAQAAGFYDQPHLIRTAREMFDALPSSFLGNPDFRLIRSDG